MWFRPTTHTSSVGTFGHDAWFCVNVMKGKSAAQTMWNWKTVQQSYDDNKPVEESSKKNAMAKKSEKEEAQKAIKIRLYPNKEQDLTLNMHWGRKSGAYSFLSSITEPVPNKLQHDSRLIRTRLEHYYLCIPKPLEIHSESQGVEFTMEHESHGAGVIALDPGVRCFQTGYDASGLTVECGKYDIGRIYRLCYVVDDLQSRWSQKDVKHRKGYRLLKAARRVRLKIRNLVDDCHKKLVKWHCENYRIVLLSEFAVS